jgi:hypothetical protein
MLRYFELLSGFRMFETSQNFDWNLLNKFQMPYSFGNLLNILLLLLLMLLILAVLLQVLLLVLLLLLLLY